MLKEQCVEGQKSAALQLNKRTSGGQVGTP